MRSLTQTSRQSPIQLKTAPRLRGRPARLIMRTRSRPRAVLSQRERQGSRRGLGVLLIGDGIGWMLFLWAPLATAVYPAIAVMGGLAKIPLLVWFLIFGVNEPRWHETLAGRN